MAKKTADRRRKAAYLEKPVSYVESDTELRICKAIKANWNRGDMEITNILLEGEAKSPQTTKLLISISDGQPRAMPDYTGKTAINEMKQVIQEYSKKRIYFLAAAIGEDKETICEIYGQEGEDKEALKRVLKKYGVYRLKL